MKIEKKRTKNKVRWLVGAIVSLALLGGMTTWVLADKKEDRNTRASSEIVLDAGTDKEFKVPVDATEIIEPKFKNDENYKDYVQTDSSNNNYEKRNYFVNSVSSLTEQYTDILYVPEKDYYIVYGAENNYSVGEVNYNSNVFIGILDHDGREVKRTYLLYGPSYYPSHNIITQTHDKILKTKDNFIVYASNGTIFGIEFDSNCNVINSKAVDISLTTGTLDSNRWLAFINTDIDKNSYISAAQYRVGLTQGILRNKILSYKLDLENNKILAPLIFDTPNFLQLNDNWNSDPYSFYALKHLEKKGNYFISQITVNTKYKTTNSIIVWDNNGKIVKQFLANTGENYYIVPDLTMNDDIYIKGIKDDITTIYRYNDDSISLDSIRTFPEKSNLNFKMINESSVQFYGFMENFDEDFIGLANSKSLVIGLLDVKNNFKQTASNFINFDNQNIVLNDIVINNDTIIIVGGLSGKSNFVEQINTGGYKAKGKQDYYNYANFVIGVTDDYAPLIKTPEKTININQTIADWDKELLDGIAVHDTYALDPNNISGQKTQTWLDQRINRNPKKIEYESDNLTAKTLPDIDWKTLGYDKTKVGPQKVTYFVTDDQNQTTSTTRIINNVTNETIDNRKAQLDAHNFTIPLTNVQKGDLATDNAIKKKAKTVAWETDSGTAVEDASADIFSNDKVIFSNKLQVDAIRNATEAKPYPLDIQYKGSSKVTNRIWVFVTADNTVVQNGVVLYADDFKLPLKEAGSSTADSLLKKDKFKDTQPNVVAYDLNAQPQDVKTLPPLSEGKKDGTSKGLSMDTNSLQRIKGSTTGGVLTGIIFTYTNPTDKKVTSVKVDVSIEESAEFCFKLERTKEELTFVDLTVDDSVNKNYRSMSIELPSFVTLTTVPSSWTRLPDQTTTSSGGATRNLYRFNMKSKNTVADIKSFLEGIKMTIASTNVNTPDTVKAYLHEEELLPDTKPKAISKDAVLKSSAVIETGDFGLYTESKWDDDAGRNYVDLQWDKVPNLSDNGYKMYQSVDGNTFEIRSIKYNKAIKVLNIYPDLPASNTLKGWMDGLGLTDKDGNNLIQVTPVSISNYNADPDKYLKNSQGNYQYDVLMFGSWDSNYSKGLSTSALNASTSYLKSGRGILFGHDTVLSADGGNNFLKLANYKDTWIFNQMKEPKQGHSVVQIINDGYMMKYPFEMKNGQKLTIPFAHNSQTFIKAETSIWLNFAGYSIPPSGQNIWNQSGYESDTMINNVYLATNNNTAMIQTGHSNGASTPDERMIIANTLYNLAQVGLEENGQDYTVKDDKAPDIVATPTRDMENNVTVEGIDFGKEYYHYVTADTKDKGLLKSDTVKTEVISDLQGYVYVVDENPTTVPNVTKDAYGKVTNITAPVTNPETDRSVTIGGFTKEGQYLHIIPVDRANNVGEVKHYKLGDLAYTEEPHQTSCQHNIPQKVYIKGKDILGNALPDGDQVLETKLRNNKKFNFTPNTITNYDYVELKEKTTGSVITPEVFTIGSTKQDAEAIYRRKSAKIHIRQQVLSPNETVVVPTQGHASFIGTDALSTGTTKMTVPFNSSDKTNLDFTDYEIEIEDTKTLLSIKDIVPMYYDLKGYVVTNTNKAHTEADMVKEINSIDLLANPEIWVTVYVEPNVTDAAFYGWMYGQTGQYTVSK